MEKIDLEFTVKINKNIYEKDMSREIFIKDFLMRYTGISYNTFVKPFKEDNEIEKEEYFNKLKDLSVEGKEKYFNYIKTLESIHDEFEGSCRCELISDIHDIEKIKVLVSYNYFAPNIYSVKEIVRDEFFNYPVSRVTEVMDNLTKKLIIENDPLTQTFFDINQGIKNALIKAKATVMINGVKTSMLNDKPKIKVQYTAKP